MTNTTNPAHTSTGIVCGKCSYGKGKDRVVLRHATVDAVRTCFSTPVLPKVEVPAPAQTPEQLAAVFEAPEATAMKRWTAKCPRKGCQTHAVKDRPFTLRCSNHRRIVRVLAKQLFGKVSTAAHHKCDDRCIYAKGNICVCACGGVNHGLGLLVTMV